MFGVCVCVCVCVVCVCVCVCGARGARGAPKIYRYIDISHNWLCNIKIGIIYAICICSILNSLLIVYLPSGRVDF